MKDTVFIEIFTDLLEENGLNMRQFSEKSGIPYSTVIGWVRHYRLPDYTALIRIADFFNCSTDYLTGRQDEFGNNIYSVENLHSEFTFIKYLRRLSAENKELIIKLAKNLSKK